ncbi:MAG TPA: CARDB domain-containing protein [Parafilimonas sp.]|nr:CARDB domain-containing protein [Parafilimonas sp.]
MKRFLLCLVLLCLLMPACSYGQQGTPVSGEQGDSTWTKEKSPYKIVGNIIVSAGKTLTIEPGVEIIFQAGSSTLDVQGTLMAEGTSTDSIKFTGTPTGFYTRESGPVILNTSSINSSLKYVKISGLGYYINTQSTAVVQMLSSNSCSITNCSILNAKGTSASIAGTNPVFSNNTIAGSVNLDVIIGINQLPVLVNDGKLKVGLTSSTLTANASISNTEQGYYMMSNLTVPAGKTLTIEPGVEIIFQAGSSTLDVQGTLMAEGTSTDSIKFTGTPTGFYTRESGPVILNTSSINSSLKYVKISGLGFYTIDDMNAVVIVKTGPSKIENCSITNTKGTALSLISNNHFILNSDFSNNVIGVLSTGADQTIKNCRFIGNTSYGVKNISSNISDTIDARYCWWGDSTGPTHPTNPPGKGDAISDRVKYIPFNTSDSTTQDTVFNKALQFDGIDDYVQIEPTAVNNLSQGTIETWIYLNSLNEEPIFSKQWDGFNTFSVLSIGYFSNDGSSNGGAPIPGIPGKIYFHSQNFKTNLSSDSILVANRWYHIAVTFNSSGATFFVNGNKAGSSVGVDYSIPNQIANINARMGSWGGDGKGYLNGKIDQFRVWNLARSQEQIQAGMCSDYSAATPGLILSYNMNEPGISTIIHDASSSQSSGTLGPAPFNPVFIDSDIPCSDTKKEQTITFNPILPKVFGDTPFVVLATASSGLPVIYSISSGPALVSHDTVTILGAGNVTIVAYQEGNEEYYPASQPQAFEIAKAIQEISFEATLDTTSKEKRYILSATASSGLPVIYSASDKGVIKGDTLTFTGSGNVTAKASQPGNANYEPASQEIIFCIAPIPPGEISGFSQTCAGAQQYSVVQENGVNYNWTLSDGGVLNKTSGSGVVVTWNKTGSFILTVTASTDCGAITYSGSKTVEVIDNINPGAATNMYPPDGTVISKFPFSVSWKPGNNSELYDVYIWEQGTGKPAGPLVSTNQIAASITQDKLPNFATGKTYNWQVTARNGCSGTESIIQAFTIAELPNLIAGNVDIPDTVNSGQLIDFKAEINNAGTVATPQGSIWHDAFYLSIDTVLDRGLLPDVYLGSKPNITALKPDSGYITGMQALLPENLVGDQYLVVVPNAFGNGLSESNLNDNIASKHFYINPTPTPDLRVTEVVPSGETFSSQKIHLSYTVQSYEVETYNDSIWKDYIYISPGQVFDKNESEELLKITHYGKLPANGEYSVDTFITIPPRIFGSYYVHVVTDAEGDVYERGSEDNNTKAGGPVTVYLTPPPDFIVSSVNVPASAVPGESITVDYTVYNAGASKPPLFGNNWVDAIFISSQPEFDEDDAEKLAIISPAPLPAMEAAESYHNTVSVKIPDGFKGQQYIYVFTDYNKQVFEYYRDDNNTNTAGAPIQINTPDLLVDSVQAADTVASGANIEVGWTVRNTGTGKVLPVNRIDKVWLCKTPVFDRSTASDVWGTTYNNALDSAAAITKALTVPVKESESGQRYIFIETDAEGGVTESNENNNISAAHPVYIISSPAPDLIALDISATPAVIVAGNTYSITYTVKNNGTGNITGKTWKDRIYRSTEPVLNGAKELRDIPESRTLLSGDTYTETVDFSTSLADMGGSDTLKWYFFVKADIDDNIYEPDNDNNTSSSSNAIAITHNPYPDLIATQAYGSDSVKTGKFITITWSVTKQAGSEGLNNYWYDAVLFSQDTIPSDNDIFAGSKAIGNPFATVNTYSQIMNIVVPNGIAGNYYMLLVTDYTHLNKDINRLNNTRVIKTNIGGGGQDTIIVHVEQSATPNLIVNSFTAPPSGYSGQPVVVKWTVSNTGDTSVGKPSWNENIYLSTDNQVDGNDKLLQAYLHTGDIPQDGFYTDSLLVFLPAGATGNYYLLFKTDGNNIIYENNKEDDNTATSFIFIQQPEPSDLTVSDISMPAQAFMGDSVNVSWRLKNIGSNASVGYMRQGIYISKDATWDKDDILLTDISAEINLAPAAYSVFNQKVKINATHPYNNFIIVRTDLLNNINETNENNNTGVSATTINVLVPELPIGGEPTPDTLYNYEALYYKIVVPDSLAGETLLVSLKGDSFNALNELYLRHDSIPTRINYDFVFPNPVSGSQDIIIPALVKGEYYLMVYGSSSSASQKQNITLHAKIINFEILSVDAKEGGNTGLVTVLITGAKFDENMKAVLNNTSLGTYTATKIIYRNSTSVFATFNLSGAKTGIYDLSLIKPGIDTATLPKEFSIVPGSGGVITGGGSGSGITCYIINGGVESLTEFNIDVDEKVRVNTPFFTLIEFHNNGNVDVEIPLVHIESIAGDDAPVSYEKILVDILKGTTNLAIDWINKESPEGTLRPGAKVYSIFFSALLGEEAHRFYEYQLIGK